MSQTEMFAPAAPPSWCDGPIAGLDFETTGTDPLTARPVSVALIVDGDDTYPRIHRLIQCGVPVPPEASAVHGITDARLLEEGADAKLIIAGVLGMLEVLAADGIPVVIMNACFDWPLLAWEAERHGLRVPDGVHLLDPGVIDRYFDKYRRGSRKLADLAEHYDVALTDAHDAAADVVAAIAVARAIARRYPAVKLAKLADLQHAQRSWFETWKNGINAYWARTGNTARVQGSWPMGMRA